ncbi:MAG: NAD(P)/FAD-dependent oxidoreductase [Chitinophagaceae bacterium]|nr:NAD(P)/FAD-dependent oxidoreductase [Oligoflexus sp.]
MKKYDFLVIGGGAAGFFAAINCAEHRPGLSVGIFEATPRVLSKVKISGGGRCNVTHNCFDPRALVRHYPRGGKELLGPFHKFGPEQTIAWFAARGVALKVEADNRMFPTTDSSQTIIDCLQGAVQKNGIELRLKALVETVEKIGDIFQVTLKGGEVIEAKTLMLATGSATFGWSVVRKLGHKLIEPNPSLFTFEIDHPLLKGLPGVSFPSVTAELQSTDGNFVQEGPLLITHWGLSGPAVLRLSAFGARVLAATDYKADLYVNFEGRIKGDEVFAVLMNNKNQEAKKKISTVNPLQGPRRFWEALLEFSGFAPDKLWADANKKELFKLSELITHFPFRIQGKGAFKEEFVTAGGVARSEIDFRSFQSKLIPGLFMAGEVIDVDGITGGFNFQNAWTGGFLAGTAAAEMVSGARAEPST